MAFEIYRIFPTLGDAIILASYIHNQGILEIHCNRPEPKMLLQVCDIYGIEPPVIKQVYDKTISYRMPHLCDEMRMKKIPLLKHPRTAAAGEVYTYQLASNRPTSKDRNMTMVEAEKHMKDDSPREDVSKLKTLDSLINALWKSKKHVTIDSGTAWVAASLGIPTTVISKNSFYFADAYFYMKYLHSLQNVTVYQNDRKGVRMPTSIEYYENAKKNKVTLVQHFDKFINTLILGPV